MPSLSLVDERRTHCEEQSRAAVRESEGRQQNAHAALPVIHVMANKKPAAHVVDVV